jgi:transposase
VLFTGAFQEELATTLYAAKPKGHPPMPPAQLALATILQAYTGVSDDEVIEATTMDRRWQLVLDCLDCAAPPFSKATLVAFRQRLIAHDADRRLIERTLEVAQDSGAFSPKALRVALDSNPLWGAGRVEDTYNLVGHALRKALSVLARQQGRGLTDVAAEAGAQAADVLGGPQSLKAALDLDWDDPQARTVGLRQVLAALEAAEQWLDAQPRRRHPRCGPVEPPRSRCGRKTSRCGRTACPRCAAGSAATGASASRTTRCATAARAGACAWTATSGMCCTIWPVDWSARWG